MLERHRIVTLTQIGTKNTTQHIERYYIPLA